MLRCLSPSLMVLRAFHRSITFVHLQTNAALLNIDRHLDPPGIFGKIRKASVVSAILVIKLCLALSALKVNEKHSYLVM